MTLKELARQAGVSVSTVSRVVNKNDSTAAGEEVRRRIWELVQQTGYLPNARAQQLRQGDSSKGAGDSPSILFVFARSRDGQSDPFFSSLLRAAEHECLRRGCRIAGVCSANGAEAPLPPCDGVLLLGRYSRSLYEALRRRKLRHMVYTGLNQTEDPCDQVVCDGYRAARAAVDYLWGLGHRDIGYVGEINREARYRGFFDGMAARGLTLPRSRIVDAPQSAEGGYSGGKRLLAQLPRPTAVFCANDLTASGVLRAAAEQGLRLPGELSVVGLDNIELCARTRPMLTSIDIPKEELGRFAAKLLLDRIQGGHRLPVRLEVPFTLVRRESCAAPLGKTSDSPHHFKEGLH